MSEEKRAGSPANRRVHPAPAPPHDGCRRHRAAHNRRARGQPKAALYPALDQPVLDRGDPQFIQQGDHRDQAIIDRLNLRLRRRIADGAKRR